MYTKYIVTMYQWCLPIRQVTIRKFIEFGWGLTYHRLYFFLVPTNCIYQEAFPSQCFTDILHNLFCWDFFHEQVPLAWYPGILLTIYLTPWSSTYKTPILNKESWLLLKCHSGKLHNYFMDTSAPHTYCSSSFQILPTLASFLPK